MRTATHPATHPARPVTTRPANLRTVTLTAETVRRQPDGSFLVSSAELADERYAGADPDNPAVFLLGRVRPEVERQAGLLAYIGQHGQRDLGDHAALVRCLPIADRVHHTLMADELDRMHRQAARLQVDAADLDAAYAARMDRELGDGPPARPVQPVDKRGNPITLPSDTRPPTNPPTRTGNDR